MSSRHALGIKRTYANHCLLIPIHHTALNYWNRSFNRDCTSASTAHQEYSANLTIRVANPSFNRDGLSVSTGQLSAPTPTSTCWTLSAQGTLYPRRDLRKTENHYGIKVIMRISCAKEPHPSPPKLVQAAETCLSQINAYAKSIQKPTLQK